MFDKPWFSAGIWLFIGLFLYALLRGLSAEGPLTVGRAQVENGALIIERARDGHYYAEGSLDGVRLTFLVDTGASVVAVSEAVADRIGLTRCRPVRAYTANGEVSACMSRARRLELGPYRIEEVDVNILPGLRGTALLGMNVLARFRIEQDRGVMRLVPP